MKKWSLLFILVISLLSNLNAQTWGEWFNQNKTQREYLVKQIGALKLYAGYLTTGIKVAHNGLQFIGAIKNGDLGQHKSYFSSLSKISPSVSKSAMIASILFNQLNILRLLKNTKKQAIESNRFSTSELDYINRVLGNLLNECSKDIEQLILMKSADKAIMKDDERLKYIQKVNADIDDKYLFARHFSTQVHLLALNRQHEYGVIQSGKILNGLK